MLYHCCISKTSKWYIFQWQWRYTFGWLFTLNRSKGQERGVQIEEKVFNQAFKVVISKAQVADNQYEKSVSQIPFTAQIKENLWKK